MSGCFMAMSDQLAAVLRYTEIPELWVLALAMGTFAVAWLCLARRLSDAALRRRFAYFVPAFLATCIVLAFVDLWAFSYWCSENHVIEWLTADCLLVAWVLGLVLTIRLSRRGRPSPMAALLTMGYFWGFWRELEWGKPFLGKKLIYMRHFFRIRPYVSVEYYDKLSSNKGVSSMTMYLMHLVGALIAIVLALVLIVYIVRHREVFRQELKRLGKAAYGRYFLLGVAIGLGANLLGDIAHRLIRRGLLDGIGWLRGLRHFVLEEPLELLATACLMMSTIALWQGTNGGRKPLSSGSAPEAQSQLWWLADRRSS